MTLTNSLAREPRIAAVVVTFNRLALLKECIGALRDQTRRPTEIFVIDNASTDGTADWLKEQSGLTVIRQANLGSSGGQYAGIKAAFQAGHDWFWLMDDDTISTPRALERLEACPYFREAWTGFLSSLVTWTDGTPHRMNTHDPVRAAEWSHTVLGDHCMHLRTASFVSLLVSRAAVTAVGLPIRDMFVWYDDMEYTARISRQFTGYGVLDSVVVHKTAVNSGPTADRIKPEEYTKYCYGLRNQLLFIRRDGASWFRTMIRVAAVCRHNVKMVLTGRAPPRMLGWMLRGLIYSPPVEFM